MGKGYQRGEDRPQAKLTEADVRAIRLAYRSVCTLCGGKKPTMLALAEQYGVSAPMIHKIVHRADWKHVA